MNSQIPSLKYLIQEGFIDIQIIQAKSDGKFDVLMWNHNKFPLKFDCHDGEGFGEVINTITKESVDINDLVEEGIVKVKYDKGYKE